MAEPHTQKFSHEDRTKNDPAIKPTVRTKRNKRIVTMLKGSDSDFVMIVYDIIFEFTDFEPFVDQPALTRRPATL